MVTSEGEKLHSDSGISVDTQSLQEQQPQAQAPPPQPHPQEQIGQCTRSLPGNVSNEITQSLPVVGFTLVVVESAPHSPTCAAVVTASPLVAET